MIPTAFFYIFSGTLITSATMVIMGRNPVHCVLFLILAFLNAAGLFLLAGAELLAMLLSIVYVGAVAVLFLFVVMMLDLNIQELSQRIARYRTIGAFVGIILMAELITVSLFWASHPTAAKVGINLETPTNTHAIGTVLYTDYFYIFQLTGVILLVAMIGAITLTFRTRPSTRRQNIQNQLDRSPANSLKMIKIAPRQGISSEEAPTGRKGLDIP